MGTTPVHDAARSGFVAVLEWLVGKRGNLQMTDHLGASAMHLVAEYGHSLTGRWLLQHGVAADALDKRGWTPAMIAASAGHIDVLAALMEFGVDMSTLSQSAGVGALHVACQAGRLDVVRWLVTIANVSVNGSAPGREGLEPVHLAAFAGHLEVVQVLEVLGADLERRDLNGANVWQIVTKRGHRRLIKWLAERAVRS